ncbi:uncharacterized protein [Musca autumnalis]|uniref:uncharacterized protein n=1 Tax=Musca autumnalis TaxID=221902 RepID=UPI003CFB158B
MAQLNVHVRSDDGDGMSRFSQPLIEAIFLYGSGTVDYRAFLNMCLIMVICQLLGIVTVLYAAFITHINQQQEDILINFMKKHPNSSKGFAKEDRTDIENLWQTLAENLNRVGPPIKETEAWKKVWIDKRSIIKRKFATNKKEVRATGGGPYNQMYISSNYEAIAMLCRLYNVVDGIGNSVACGFQSVEPEEERPATSSDSSDMENVVDELPSTSDNAQKKKKETKAVQKMWNQIPNVCTTGRLIK